MFKYVSWKNMREKNYKKESKWWKDIKEICRSSNANEWFDDRVGSGKWKNISFGKISD